MSDYKLTLLYTKGIDYKTRNFILLLVLLVLTVLAAILINRGLSGRYDVLKTENAELERELTQMRYQAQQGSHLMEELERMQEQHFLMDKIIPDANNTTLTLSYIFSILREYRSHFDFDFMITESGYTESDEDLKYNLYEITGKAPLSRLFVFIDQLERQPVFYTIESLSMESLQVEEGGQVRFTLTFRGYSTETGTSFARIGLRPLQKRQLPYNIFYPRIHEPYLPEQDAGYPDIDDLEVVGLTRDQVYIRDRSTQSIMTFSVGEKVRHGFLDRIDWTKQEAVFKINRIGLIQEYRLSRN